MTNEENKVPAAEELTGLTQGQGVSTAPVTPKEEKTEEKKEESQEAAA